jgi:hypothetical protein
LFFAPHVAARQREENTMSRVPSLLGKSATKREAAPPPKAPDPMKWYRYTGPDKLVPRPHGDFKLRTGKEINSRDYDVGQMVSLGLTFEEIPTPGWFVLAQEKGEAKYLELQERGIDLPEPPPYEAAPPPAVAS